MKRLVSIVAMLLPGLWLFGCSSDYESGSTKPDLVVVAFEIRGPVVIDNKNRAIIPVHVAVKNKGAAVAGIFKVAAMYKGAKNVHAVEFMVSDESRLWYPYSRDSLGLGDEAVFNGTIIFAEHLQGMMVPLYAVADSCIGEEYMPAYCHVDESNEVNNQSNSVLVTLP